MRWINETTVAQSLDFPALLTALLEHFGGDFQQPARQLLTLQPARPDQPARHDALALLPAWNDEYLGCKLFSYFPDNPVQGKPRLYSKLMLFSARDGGPLALMDAVLLTHWRTAAVSALAARFLAKPSAATLLICGSGQLAPYFARAYAAALPLKTIHIWGRDPAKAEALVAALNKEPQFANIHLQAVTLDEATVAGADVVSCISAATAPLFPASWVRPGTLIDAVGNHRADVSEIDPQLVVAGELYVDSRANCLREAGEILLPLHAGAISEPHVKGELADLCRAAVYAGAAVGEARYHKSDKVMIFKAVGTALADLAAATLVYRQALATGKGQQLD